MTPNLEWLDQRDKYKIKPNAREVEWKNFMSEILNKTEFPTDEKVESDVRCLNLSPNIVMDTRHAMARFTSYSRKNSTPKEIVKTEAARSLREENHKILLKRKQEMLVLKEIATLTNLLEDYKLVRKKEILKKENPRVPFKMISHQVKLEKKCSWRNQDSRKTDTTLGQFSKITTGSSIKGTDISFDVVVGKQNEKIADHPSRPVSRNRKGSETNSEYELHTETQFWNNVCNRDFFQCEIMKRFFENQTNNDSILEEEMKAVEIKDKKICSLYLNIQPVKKINVKPLEKSQSDDKQRVKRAWRAWRMHTLIKRKNKKEKIEHQTKIEKFLEKLTQKDTQEFVSLKKNFFNTSHKKPKTKLKQNKLKTQSSETKIIAKRQEEETNAENIMRDVEKSKRETHKSLINFEKLKLERKERLKVLKTLSNIREDSDDTMKVFPYPKFLLRMEKRKEEQLNRRRELRERKRKLEEKQKIEEKQKEEEIRAAREKEKRENIEKIKEKRRLEKEMKQKKKEEREKTKRDSQLADEHYRKFLVRKYGFEPWLALMNLIELQWETAEEFDRKRWLRKAFYFWKDTVRNLVEKKIEKATKFYYKALQRNCFFVWIEVREETIRKYQVAADWHDLKLTDKTFSKWVQFTKDELSQFLEKKEVAESYYEGKLKFHCLVAWRNYPVIKRMEIAKEKRKQVWREMVQEVLPDYRPDCIRTDS